MNIVIDWAEDSTRGRFLSTQLLQSKNHHGGTSTRTGTSRDLPNLVVPYVARAVMQLAASFGFCLFADRLLDQIDALAGHRTSVLRMPDDRPLHARDQHGEWTEVSLHQCLDLTDTTGLCSSLHRYTRNYRDLEQYVCDELKACNARARFSWEYRTPA